MAKPKGLGAPIVMERGAKVACYGREGTGKTELVMSARNVGRLILLDTEGRSQYYDPDAGYGFEVKYSKSAEDALELLRYAEELHRQGEKVVFGIDSYSSLWFAQQEVAEEAGATRTGNAKFHSWGVAKRPLKRLYAALFETPVDCIITMRAKPRYEQDVRTKEVKDYGYDVADTERGLGYTVDLIVELGRKQVEPGTPLIPDDYWAVVTKSSGERDNKLPIGTKITDPSFSKLVALRLEGAPGGITFDEDVLLQVGLAASRPGDFKRWVANNLKLDPEAIVEKLKEQFGDLGSDMAPYVQWTWDYYLAQHQA